MNKQARRPRYTGYDSVDAEATAELCREVVQALVDADADALADALARAWVWGGARGRSEVRRLLREPSVRALLPEWQPPRGDNPLRTREGVAYSSAAAVRAAAKASRAQRPHIHGRDCRKAWTRAAEARQKPQRRRRDSGGECCPA